MDTSPIAPALAAFFDNVLDASVSTLNFKAIVDGLGEVLFRWVGAVFVCVVLCCVVCVVCGFSHCVCALEGGGRRGLGGRLLGVRCCWFVVFHFCVVALFVRLGLLLCVCFGWYRRGVGGGSVARVRLVCMLLLLLFVGEVLLLICTGLALFWRWLEGAAPPASSPKE